MCARKAEADAVGGRVQRMPAHPVAVILARTQRHRYGCNTLGALWGDLDPIILTPDAIPQPLLVVHAREVHGVGDFGARFLPRQWPHGLQGSHGCAVGFVIEGARGVSRGRRRRLRARPACAQVLALLREV